MRVTLAVLGLCLLLGLGGCACAKWQPDCCNNWDWYDPCDMVEGREARECRNKGCRPQECAPGVIVMPTQTNCAPGTVVSSSGNQTIMIIEDREEMEAPAAK